MLRVRGRIVRFGGSYIEEVKLAMWHFEDKGHRSLSCVCGKRV